MEIILLHSAQVEASRNVLAELPAGITVIDKHSEAVQACPNFSAYPALVVKDGDTMRVLSPFSTWAEAQAFIDNPPAPQEASRPRTMTKYYFRTRVLTFEERVVMDNSVIPELVTMRNDLFAAEVVDLDEVAKYKPVMLATGLASEERIDEIIAGVTHG